MSDKRARNTKSRGGRPTNATSAKLDIVVLRTLEAKSADEIADEVGVSTRTLARWKDTDAYINRENLARSESIRAMAERLRSKGVGVIDILFGIAKDESEAVSARVSACKAILDHIPKYRERFELEEAMKDIQTRLKALSGPAPLGIHRGDPPTGA